MVVNNDVRDAIFWKDVISARAVEVHRDDNRSITKDVIHFPVEYQPACWNIQNTHHGSILLVFNESTMVEIGAQPHGGTEFKHC